eukprot:16451-Heterococcus_DN1.PRE.1
MSLLHIVPGAVQHVTVAGRSTGSIAATKLSDTSTSITAMAWTATANASRIALQTLSAKTSLRAGAYTITVMTQDGSKLVHTYYAHEPIRVRPGAVTRVSIHGAANGSIGPVLITGGSGQYST